MDPRIAPDAGYLCCTLRQRIKPPLRSPHVRIWTPCRLVDIQTMNVNHNLSIRRYVQAGAVRERNDAFLDRSIRGSVVNATLI